MVGKKMTTKWRARSSLGALEFKGRIMCNGGQKYAQEIQTRLGGELSHTRRNDDTWSTTEEKRSRSVDCKTDRHCLIT